MKSKLKAFLYVVTAVILVFIGVVLMRLDDRAGGVALYQYLQDLSNIGAVVLFVYGMKLLFSKRK